VSPRQGSDRSAGAETGTQPARGRAQQPQGRGDDRRARSRSKA
jgi:hypothetical protein